MGGIIMKDVFPNYNGMPLRWVWTYYDVESKPLMKVARYDSPNRKKEVIPYHQDSDGQWKVGAVPKPYPLFGLDSLNENKHSEFVFIVEGEKCASALRSLGFIAFTSIGGADNAFSSDWTPCSGLKNVIIMPDNDEPGRKYCADICSAIDALDKPPQVFKVELRGIQEGEDIVDWIKQRISCWDTYSPIPEENGKEIVAELLAEIGFKIPIGRDQKTIKEHDWPKQISLQMKALPLWSDNLLPSPLREFVSELSNATETPKELSAFLALSVIATTVQGKYRVKVKPDYFEPVNIWTCVALPPGNRKTAVLGALTQPLMEWEDQQRILLEPIIAKMVSEEQTLNAKINALRQKAGKSEGSNLKEIQNDILQYEAELPLIPKMPQLWTSDVTPENLGVIMAENDERMAILSDEGGIFDILAGRYSNGIPNLDIFLQSHAGSSVRVNRGSRSPLYLHKPALSLGLSPQPDVLKGLTANPSFRGRGLLARFLYGLPPSTLGYRLLNTQPISSETRVNYSNLMHALLSSPWSLDEHDKKTSHVIKLSADSYELWKCFERHIEPLMRVGEKYSHITDWAGKLAGAIVRMAGLLHIIRHAFQQPWLKAIQSEDMQAAIDIGNIMGEHALAVFEMMGADPAVEGAHIILYWIQKRFIRSFTFRECHQAHKSRFKKATQMRPAMEVLIEEGILRRVEATNKVAHRPSEIFQVNPHVIAEKDSSF
jgi:hypothetical protein